MFEFLKSKKRKEQERLQKEASDRAQQRRVARESTNTIDGMDYSSAYWITQSTSPWQHERSFITVNETSNKLSEGFGSFSGAGSSSSWDDDSASSSGSSSYSSSSPSSSYSSSSSSDSCSSSSDSSSSYSSD